MANQLWVTCKQVLLFSWKQSSERRWKNTEKWIRRSSSAIGDLLRTLHWALQSALPFQPRRLSCVVSAFSEKCYETVHLRYYDIGESWGRIHLRNVEQCTCVAGEIKCERVHYTSKTCFLLLLFCSECVQLFFSWPFFAIFGVMRAKLNRLQWLQRYLLWQLLELMLKSANDKRNIATCWNVLGFVCFYIK